MNTATLLRRASLALLNLVMPEQCVVCDRESEYICAGCAVSLPDLGKPYCFICASPGVPQLCDICRVNVPAFDSIRAPYEFRGAVRQMTHDLKYRGVRIAAPYMAGLLAEYLERNPYPVDVLLPVPLHWWRERERGYNQSALLADELGRLAGIPVDTFMLKRIRNTPPQVNMESSSARRRNIIDAFQCTQYQGVEGLRCMLIDDVVTTGSTMSACAYALKDAGAAFVWGIAFARQGGWGDDAN